MSRILIVLPTLLLLASASHASAAPLFDDDDILEVRLTGPLSEILQQKGELQEQPFTLLANGVEHQIKVRTRGKSRRRVCHFPPLRFNFDENDPTGSVFAGQDKIKLVTHCRSSDAAQADALEEYAAYKIFSLLSDVSYKVRLLDITYIDTGRDLNGQSLRRYGFVIEPPSQLATRLGGHAADVPDVSLHALNAQQAALVYIFQYLIGNTDWSLVTASEDDTCCHNIHLYDVESERFIVPYDLDLAGLVNARYAKPDPDLRLSSVRQRRYRGFCISHEELKDALVSIRARRSEILGTIATLPGLSQKHIASRTKYLRKFFDRAQDEDKLLRSFERRCLKP